MGGDLSRRGAVVERIRCATPTSEVATLSTVCTTRGQGQVHRRRLVHCAAGKQRLRDVPRTLRQRYIDADQISGQGREIGPPCDSVLTEKNGCENVGHAISSLQRPLLLGV